ncbi:hypothetical protein GCM10009846_26330 [Agrococcus versicolor]|uniref:DUF2550 domain-containing protein n=1 Tax=Agrococcus versicolor TaxID=501482 RepID=A0ABN3AXH5_9MICO
MTLSAPPRRSLIVVSALLAFAAFVLGVLITLGGTAIAWRLVDESRPGLMLAELMTNTTPGFADAPRPAADACGDRFGCMEGVEGDGVSMYRYFSLDLARQAVVYDDSDLYRSDRIVIVFDADGLSADERFQLLQVVESTWTGSSD